MTAKKLIALLMAVCLLAFAFVSCGKKGDGEETSGTGSSDPIIDNGLSVDLKNYQLIYADGVSVEVESAFNKLSAVIYELTGERKAITKDTEVAADNTAYEILVGDTNREQSAAAKQKLTQSQYCVTKDGNKIVVVASDFIILEDAVNYLIETVRGFYEGKGEMLAEVISEPYTAYPLTTNGKANYKVVFTDFYNNFNLHSDGNGYDEGFGFTREKVRSLVSDLKKLTGATFEYYPQAQMKDDVCEIVVGKFDGIANNYFDYYQSGVYLKDGDIYIYGHNHEGIEAAIEAFFDRVTLYKTKNGTADYTLYCDTVGYKASNYNLEYGIPLPKDMEFEGAYSAPENRVCFVYENCTRDTFNQYTALLEAQSFEKYFFREAGKTSINVFAGYHKGDEAAWVYYIHDRAELRIIFEKYQPLPEFEIGEKVTDTSYAQIGFDYTTSGTIIGAGGMCYVITLEDGSYVIVDGGGISNSGSGGPAKNKAAAEALHAYLTKNNKRADGKIVISAWLLTHSHVDHVAVFQTFGTLYGKEVTVKHIIYNQPTKLTMFGASNAGGPGGNPFTETLEINAKNYPGATVHLLHTGAAFELAGVYLEIMSTYEDLYNHDKTKHEKDPYMPNAVDEGNDTCITFRFWFNKGKADEAIVFNLGDVYFAHGERLASMWDSDYMKSTAVQAAHHGYHNGATSGQVDPGNARSTTYNEIKAEYCFWSNSYNHYNRADTVKAIFRRANGKVQFLVNCDQNGNALISTLTFNGGVKVTQVKK